MFLNLRALLLVACIAIAVAETALVRSEVLRTESVGDVNSDVGKRLSTAQDEASPSYELRAESDVAVRGQTWTERRLRRFRSHHVVQDGLGISRSCRNRADLTAALAAAYDLALRARDNTKTKLWEQ